MPEIKLVLVVMAFVKILFFVRIFKSYAFLVQMIWACLMDLVPFIVSFISFLLVFSVCYNVLDMEIDPEVAEARGIQTFEKLVLQTFRTSIGELGMPVYDGIYGEEQDDVDAAGFEVGDHTEVCTFWQCMNIWLIWVIWYMQSFFMLVVMLNFIIAVISATYTKVVSVQQLVGVKYNAELNLEVFYVMNMLKKKFGRKMDNIKLMSFSNVKSNEDNEEDAVERAMNGIKKMVGKQLKGLDHEFKHFNAKLTDVNTKVAGIDKLVITGFDKLAALAAEVSKKLDQVDTEEAITEEQKAGLVKEGRGDQRGE